MPVAKEMAMDQVKELTSPPKPTGSINFIESLAKYMPRNIIPDLKNYYLTNFAANQHSTKKSPNLGLQLA